MRLRTNELEERVQTLESDSMYVYHPQPIPAPLSPHRAACLSPPRGLLSCVDPRTLIFPPSSLEPHLVPGCVCACVCVRVEHHRYDKVVAELEQAKEDAENELRVKEDLVNQLESSKQEYEDLQQHQERMADHIRSLEDQVRALI